MTIAEILETVRFVISPSGKKSAVIVDLDIWEQIVAMLEDLEDLRIIAERKKEATLSYKQLVAKLKRHGLI